MISPSGHLKSENFLKFCSMIASLMKLAIVKQWYLAAFGASWKKYIFLGLFVVNTLKIGGQCG